jgi:Putative abortive phage resistance protein AbiGi, antitoxin
MEQRRFFHSFPRPKKGETEDATLARSIRILEFMMRVGLVLAPEVVNWDMRLVTQGAKQQLSILQRRVSFTELDMSELTQHSAAFGLFSLSFDIAKLRAAGATPVIYVPQATADSPLTLFASFCVNGVHHTKYVLSQLQQLKELSDHGRLAEMLKEPVSPECKITLTNTDAVGGIAARYTIPVSAIRDILQYVGFNSIPFDHSNAVLGYFLNLFYPTDNAFKNDQLGYYRQREWRLIASDLGIKGRPIARKLSGSEVTELEEIDPEFWRRELKEDNAGHRRSALALVYDPLPGWELFNLVEEVLVPEHAVDRSRAVVGDRVPVRAAK